MTTELRDKLFAVIRAGMDQRSDQISLSAEDCKELMQLGAHQSILPIIHRGLQKMDAPVDLVNVNSAS